MLFAYVKNNAVEKISSSDSVEWNDQYITNVRSLSPEERKDKGIYDFIQNTSGVPKYKRPLASVYVIDSGAGTVTETVPCENISVDEVKASKLSELASLRYIKEVSGIDINGDIIKTDRESQATLTGAYVKMQLDPIALIDWKSATGWIQIDKATVEALAMAVANHVQYCFSKEKEHSENIEALTDYDALVAYDITVGLTL